MRTALVEVEFWARSFSVLDSSAGTWSFAVWAAGFGFAAGLAVWVGFAAGLAAGFAGVAAGFGFWAVGRLTLAGLEG